MNSEQVNELPRNGSLFSFIATICLIVPLESYFISYLTRDWIHAGGIAWADAWVLPILAVLFVFAAAPGLSIITQHPYSNKSGATALRWVVIGVAVLLWICIDSPTIGWSLMCGLSPLLWITFSYKWFTRKKSSSD